MMIISTLYLLIWCISVDTRYILYDSNIRQSFSYPTFDCLYAYLIDDTKEIGKPYIRNSHLIPYCRRPDYDNEKQDEILYPITENIAKTISFKELKMQNITSEQLLEWFASIDLAEKYQMNLDDSDVFHNCSSPWFGSHCQYKFNYNPSLSFTDIIHMNFVADYNITYNISSGTCYRFLSGCYRGLWPSCFHWHEICDGKVDCMNGEDEEWCDKLEMNACNSTEYRCHYGGQCIPLSFVKDSRHSVDCLDGSDEREEIGRVVDGDNLINAFCSSVSTFRCQERIGRYPWSFQCGDGEYVPIGLIPTYHIYCQNKKEKELSRLILTSMNHISNITCQKAFYCALHFNRTFGYKSGSVMTATYLITFNEGIWNEDCEPLSKHCSSEWLVIPAYPILFGMFQFIYFTNRSVNEFKQNIAPDLVCFYAQRCPMLLSKIIAINITDGLTCSHLSNIIPKVQINDFRHARKIFDNINNECLKKGMEKSCQNSSYFYCNESMKCIPYHRVGDGNTDCNSKEDENYDTCQLNDSKRYKCPGNSNKCLLSVAIGNGKNDCPLGEDELFIYAQNFTTLVSFGHLCNTYPNYDFDYFSLMETDETNCNWWPCYNSYTHCDGTWQCFNGVDELNCPNTNCSSNEHQCQNEHSGSSYCLPFTHIYEKDHDYCRGPHQNRLVYFYNETKKIDKRYFSWNDTKCITSEKLCPFNQKSPIPLTDEDVCLYEYRPMISISITDIKVFPKNQILCKFKSQGELPTYNIGFFKTTRLGYLPEISGNIINSSISKLNQNQTIVYPVSSELNLYCHRGIALLTAPNQTIECLCPPNYFGNRCQWQNQRISLTLQLLWRSTEYKIDIFQLIIMIIDQNGQITPYYEQITYVPNRDCSTKFNIYLLYPDRPKSLSKNYSIRIDLYEKMKLKYWASWFISIPFQFLPVNRIISQLIIPEKENDEECTLSCGEYGKCRSYINNKSLLFCQCHDGYSGLHCEIKDKCNCANDSFCFNSSICICPLNKFGRYCYLKHLICQPLNNPCQNKGNCVPIDDRIGLKQFTCFCPDGYSGEKCENKNNQIDIHLDQTLISNISLLLLHFITSFPNAEHERRTILKKIPFDERNLTIDITQSFNILLIQTRPNQNYYLAVLREVFLPTEHIYTEIQSNRRCSSLNEINKTLSEYLYLIRVKYYPLLCRQNSELMCFYDGELMCICDIDRFSNCFLFNQTIENDCQNYNYCENDGECFQNNQTCPTKLTCVCQDCFYGAKCQLSSKGFITSLDSILGYHIKPNRSINEQSLIIKISIAITTIIFALGLINGILSTMTFHRQKSRQVGTGYYLLCSSIVSIIIIILLQLKFWLLILSQMSLITNQSYLKVNCILIDVSLRIALSMNEWLNACVAMERMISVIQDVLFNRKKSQKMSKLMIPSLFLIIILTYIHDPIHRELIEDYDIDEYRIWCFIKYSSSFEIYNSFITLFHFLVPFLINIISAIWIVLKISLKRSGVQHDQTFKQHLRRQIKEHRPILIAPCVLILLALPRLIISFSSGCMRSAREPWLYLFGYFLSFIPSILTFVIFVLPSTMYKDEFNVAVQQIIRRFQTRF